MYAYVVRRLLLIPITLLIISMIVFLLARIIPGDVVDVIVSQMEQTVTDIDRDEILRRLGLDRPIYEQYGVWIAGIVRGDFGETLHGARPVSEEIFARFPVTLELGLLALIITEIIAIPLGVYSGIRQDTATDYALRSIAIVMISVPLFWIATLVMIYPSIWWGWSPPTELIKFGDDPIGNLGMFLLPATIMGFAGMGGTMRMTRTMMLEVLRQDYVRTAWAKGLNERTIIIKHALKNALIPVVTLIGGRVPMVLGGSVIMEQIFCLPGMGRLLLDSLHNRDYPIISGINLILSTFVVFCNLIVDLTYGWLDPRVKY